MTEAELPDLPEWTADDPEAAGGGAPGAHGEEGAELLADAFPESKFESSYRIGEVVEALEAEEGPVEILGASEGFRACVLADLSRRLDRPLVVLTADAEDAERVAEDLALFASGDDEPSATPPGAASDASCIDDVVHLPRYDIGPYHEASADRLVRMERLSTLYRLTRRRDPRFTVASIEAATRRSIPVEAMELYSRRIQIGDEMSNEALRSRLTACGYSEVPVVEDPGTFAVRGDIVDLYSPADEHPIRLERWGDEISEMRAFNAEDQRTIEELEACEVFPIREEVLDEPTVDRAAARLRDRANELELSSRQVRSLLEDLRAGIHFIGIEALLPALYPRSADLFDYVSADPLVVVVDPDGAVDSLESRWSDRSAELERALDEDELVFPVSAYYRPPDETVERIEGRPRIEMRRVAMEPADEELALSLPDRDRSFEFRARPNTDVVKLRKEHRSTEKAVEQLCGEIESWREQYGRICVACRTPGQVERMVGLLKRHGLDAIDLPTPVDVSEPVPPPADIVEVYEAQLSAGFRSEILGLALLSGSEVFGQRVKKESQKSVTEHAEISHFRDLSVGDHIVHVDFGIGRYCGLVHLDVEGVENDFLHIEYADGDKLYLPVYRLGRVQKYIGSGEQTRLDRLGSDRWEETKEEVKARIRDLADDLLRLYAEREMAEGYAFSGRDAYFRKFEEDFPFEETPDQAEAIEETLEDMQKTKPMDRLICGDVGFGKTEVAMRAAMKAVLDGKQVAVLVPTTILCEQHRRTFKKRLEPYGATVEALSRFRSSSQSREIIEGAAEGGVDLLIGTHRLLSDDIEFDDLGLLVVDEEQRFGVEHKEEIKKLRTNVDVLTLTATPIPRTLQMSLLGIRDLSIIATPPHNRLAVRTHVAKFSEGIVREAVMREIERGGQVFFVHNRVRTIDEMAAHLEEIVPEARIDVAHGQMAESELEDAMLSYVQGDINVLLCSTIIESGLDIPNANTIIINEANNFGLSQLYQLRGRVGRSDERAYAYLLVPRQKSLSQTAEKRLEVIQSHSELGSGFHVATYDLEIRGAGNLLGKDQSGHVEEVGLDLYTELLEDAIDELRDREVEDEIEPEVNLPVEAFIPDDYIDETSLRLTFYKRLSLSSSTDELLEIYDEMADRFGMPPEPVDNLRELVAVKIACRDLRASQLDAGSEAIKVQLEEDAPLDPGQLVELVRDSEGDFELTSDRNLLYALDPDEVDRPLEVARWLMDRLQTARSE